MKKYLFLMIPLLFAACSNPLLKWIETPGENSRSVSAGPPPLSHEKAITAFSFGLPDEEISVRGGPGQDGTIPIKAVLPPNTSLTGLEARITYIGASIIPRGGGGRRRLTPIPIHQGVSQVPRFIR
jgi:hypothetical protein